MDILETKHVNVHNKEKHVPQTIFYNITILRMVDMMLLFYQWDLGYKVFQRSIKWQKSTSLS